ncbi:MAG: hypothetical protein H7Z42_04935 [Roseiflexaceae bacterium]|nr:hypothetical protein [Roseiflexaceae bacterium]
MNMFHAHTLSAMYSNLFILVLVLAAPSTVRSGLGMDVSMAPRTWGFSAKLVSNDSTDGSTFGSQIAMSADGATIVVGAPHDQAVYIYKRPADGWKTTPVFTAKLTGPSFENEFFGTAVAISADATTIVVGSMYYGFMGASDTAYGAAYLYSRASSSWVSTSAFNARLTASSSNSAGMYGDAVAISADGTTVAVGAPRLPRSSSTGTVFVYVQPTTGWASAMETAQLMAANGSFGDNLGLSVAVSSDGSVIAAGADRFNSSSGAGGFVNVYERPERVWITATETARLTAADAADRNLLGTSIAISADGSAIIAGAPQGAVGAGGGYLFDRSSSRWSNTQSSIKLTNAERPLAYVGNFGSAVGMSADGRTIVIGAPSEDANGDRRGAIYFFVRPTTGVSATQAARLTASDAGDVDEFGSAVAMSADGTTVVASAPFARSSNIRTGAVYVHTAITYNNAVHLPFIDAVVLATR